jgi:serine/threonine protein kinase
MGEVYRARDTKLNRDVALKVLPDSFANDSDRLARFTREAQTLASLNHPNIAAIYGLEESGGMTALVMELVEGDDLSQRIAQGAIPLDEALPIAKQIAEALEAAHEQGIIHRDLKPANIKVRSDGTVKVLDFGLAKAMEPSSALRASAGQALSQAPTITTPAMMTGAGMILGTAAYMSPEQARGKSVDKRADIWAFGAVLYEMLTGRRLFAADEVTDTLAFVITKQPDWQALPPELPASVTRVLRRCLEKDVRGRLRDIGDARIELMSTEDQPLATAQGLTTFERPRHQRLLLTVSVVATLAAIASVPIVVQHLRETESRPPAARFTVEIPADVLRTIGGNPIISPDGRQVVFRGQAARGSSLWIQSLDSQDVRELPESIGTELDPFWSADSQALAFVAGGRLWRLRLSDGQRTPIADLPAGTARLFGGGAWSPSGDIIFAFGAGLYRVDSSGRAEAVPGPGRDDADLAFRFPVFLPDGRHFLFSIQSNKPGRAGVYVGDREGGEFTFLAPQSGIPRSASYSDGYLLYVRDGFPVAQKLDLESFDLSGEPSPIGALGNGGVSASANGRLVFRDASKGVVQLTWMDRFGESIGTVGSPDRYPTFDLSADGRLVVVARGDQNLWNLDAVSGAATRLTIGAFTDVDPRWSPDARRVIFGSTRAAGRAPHEISATGGIPALLMPWTRPTFSLDDWTADGRHILYHDTTGGAPEMWALPLTGNRKPMSVAKPLAGLLDQGQFSPDGRFVAFNADESGAYEVYAVPFPPTGERWQISRSGGVQPMWRQDGKELFYRTLDGDLTSVSVDSTSGFSTDAPQRLFKAPLRASFQTEDYAVAPPPRPSRSSRTGNLWSNEAGRLPGRER